MKFMYPFIQARLFSRLCVVAFLAFAATSVLADPKNILPSTCFMSDGTLVKSNSIGLSFIEPITESPRFNPVAVEKIIGVICNPAKMQVLIKTDGKWNDEIWKNLTIESNQTQLKNIPTSGIDKPDRYFFNNYNNTFYGVTGEGHRQKARAIAFSKDGELVVVSKMLGYDGRDFISIFSTRDFSEVKSVNLQNLLGRNFGRSQFLAIAMLTADFVDLISTASGDRYVNGLPGTPFQRVRWYYKDNRVTRFSQPYVIAAIHQGPISDAAFFDLNPNVGYMIGEKVNNRLKVHFFNESTQDTPAATFEYAGSDHTPLNYGAWLSAGDQGLLVGSETRYENGKFVYACGDAWGAPRQVYIMNATTNEFSPQGCGKMDEWGKTAVDTERGYILNTSRYGLSDRLLDIHDLSDIRVKRFDQLREKYNVGLRMAFSKAGPKVIYVPSVSNTKTYSETMFYIGGQPVTRYLNNTITDEGYKEAVNLYDVAYEVRNNYAKSLLIRFRLEGLATNTSWAVSSVKGGFWQGLFGGHSEDKNIREKTVAKVAIRLEKTLLLKAGESFKAKDVWGEMPESDNPVSFKVIDVQEVDEAWLAQLNDLLAGRKPVTQESLAGFIGDQRAEWAKPKLLELAARDQKQREEQERQKASRRNAEYAKLARIVSTKIPTDYDPDFGNEVSVVVENGNSVDLVLVVRIGQASQSVTVPARSSETVRLEVKGIQRTSLKPTLSVMN